MTTWTELYSAQHLISRTFYGDPGTFAITAPARAAVMRVSGVGAGGWAMGGNWGGGAAFARSKRTVTPGQAFSLQVGGCDSTWPSSGAGTAAGDTILTRVSDSVVIMKACRGFGVVGGGFGGRGLASLSVGDVTRDGGDGWGAGKYGGASGSDINDDFSLGFGGPGARQHSCAGPGGGGVLDWLFYTNGSYDARYTLYAGNGRACVEFFDVDPGYS